MGCAAEGKGGVNTWGYWGMCVAGGQREGGVDVIINRSGKFV